MDMMREEGTAIGRFTAAHAVPHIVSKNGKFALMVDDAPYLILAGQANNSSNYPEFLPKVWPAIADMKANTLAMPVAWEQIEPVEGKFDFSFVDTLINQARARDVRLALLWFGTWKNTNPNYAPAWVKLDNQRFPRLTKKDGSTSNALSPHHKATLEADIKAYSALMRHLKKIDGKRHTVILMQPENEAGVFGSLRLFAHGRRLDEPARAAGAADAPEQTAGQLERGVRRGRRRVLPRVVDGVVC